MCAIICIIFILIHRKLNIFFIYLKEIAREIRPKTIRARFGENTVKNALHCTDLQEDCSLEVEYFFKILTQ